MLKVNGETHRLVVDNRAVLADVLRNELGLTGTKVHCRARPFPRSGSPAPRR